MGFFQHIASSTSTYRPTVVTVPDLEAVANHVVPIADNVCLRNPVTDDHPTVLDNHQAQLVSNSFEYNIGNKHQSVTSMFQEWVGTHLFSATINPKCYPGGIVGLMTSKMPWRRSFTQAQAKHFSRLKYVMNKVTDLVENHGKSLDEALQIFDRIFNVKKSLYSLEQFLKEAGGATSSILSYTENNTGEGSGK